MSLLLFFYGGSTIGSTYVPPAPPDGLFAVSGGTNSDIFPVTAVSYTYSPASKRTE